MKTLLKKMTTATLFLAGSLVVASADPVVFNVNMSVQSALGRFNPGNGDVIAVLGLGGDWSTGISMEPSSNPDVYSVTNSLAALSWPNYKFVIKPAGGAWIWEDGNNRWFQVPSGGTNLPVAFFNNVTNVPAGPTEITFQLSMYYAIRLGLFNPDTDYVSAFGSFDSWGTTGVILTNVPGTSNYLGTLSSTLISTNSLVNYKYAINGYGGTWEGNVGPNGAQNRSFTVTNSTQLLALDYWNNITNLAANALVGFAVNLTADDAFGVFTPGADTVFVSGDWNWNGAAFQLTQVGSSDVYTGAVNLAIAAGTTVNYKYTLNGGLLWENDGVGPAGARNRQFVLNTSTNLPMDYFNGHRDLGPLYISRSGMQTTLTWPAGTNINNRIRLQSAPSPVGNWTEVPNSLGQSSVTDDFGSGPVYFRLIGP